MVKVLEGIKNFLSKYLASINNYHKGLLLVLLIWGNYFIYIWQGMFFWGPDGIYAGWIGIWGDWAAHNTYASRFAYLPISEWIATHPLYIGTKFTYPFLANFISGMFIRLGVDRVNAFVIPTIITTLIFLWLLYKFYYSQLKTYRKSVLAVFVFLTSGGLGFFWFFKDLAGNIKDPWGTLAFPPEQYTQLKEGTIYWLNTITGQLIPQRALLLGMTLGLFIICMLFILIKRRSDKGKVLLNLVLLGFLTSILILAHMHTFISVFVLCFVTLLLNWRKWKLLLIYAVATVIPSFIFYSILYGGAIGTSFFSWHPGWLANPNSKDMNFIYFWFVNWGLFLPLAVIGAIKHKMLKNEFFLTGLILFILCNLFLFQPFDWDNSKVLTWVYLFWTIPVVKILAYLWQRKFILFKALSILLLFVISFSGLLDIYRLTKINKLKLLMYTTEDMRIAEEFKQISRPTDIVLTSDKHNHWISNLTGRQILLGYRGWIWTYGIHDGEVYQDIKDMYAGEANTLELLQKYEIAYVVIGPSEKFDYDANEEFFSTHFTKVLFNTTYNVYKVY